MQKYSVNQQQVSNLLSWVRSGEIAIPEIQRPFVWETTKIRDLIDSLYRGFPVGYIIVWQNPTVKLKNGGFAAGKKILIDGQQRITALKAAIVGDPIVNKEYKEIHVRISFNPQTEEFMTRTPALARNPAWIEDISTLMTDDGSFFDVIDTYLSANPDADKGRVRQAIQNLVSIKTKQIGLIELDSALDIETVTEIFVRINSQGVVLSQADFVMSKIAAQGEFGENLRKLIDYFCHLSTAPQFYDHIKNNDKTFRESGYLDKIAWLRDENDDLFDPDYNDVIRVVTVKEFERGKTGDLVSLLSGRDFETREYREEIRDQSFKKMEQGTLDMVNETNFKRFLMILKSAGYVSKEMMTSKNAINFAYALFLKLRSRGENSAVIESAVRRWFVMTMLTGRHSGSFETQFEFDIKRVASLGADAYLRSIEDGELTDGFWNVRLVQELEKASTRNPFITAFYAAQIKAGDKGFLSTDITVQSMILHRGDIHHIFPRKYLIDHGATRSEYNQLANFAQTQTEINIGISDMEPAVYMQLVMDQIKSGVVKLGGIRSEADLMLNLAQNCIPQTILKATYQDYSAFLADRRKLMAVKIHDYYKSL